MSTVRETVRHLSVDDKPAHRKRDFSWRGRDSNPFLSKGAVDWKLRLKMIIFALTLTASVLLMLLHPVFAISVITVEGLSRISSHEVQSAVHGIMDHKRLLIFPGNNFFMVDLNEVRDIIKERFPLQSIAVAKKFPNTLHLTLSEKTAALIYDNGAQYSYLDEQGNMVEILRNVSDYEWKDITRIVTSTNADGTVSSTVEIVDRVHTPDVRHVTAELGAHAVVYDKRAKDGTINDEMVSAIVVQGILDWYEFLSKTAAIPVHYFIIENELGDVIIKTKEGWDIRARLKNEVSRQFADLMLLIKDPKKIDRSTLQYLDVRYDGRVYWQ